MGDWFNYLLREDVDGEPIELTFSIGDPPYPLTARQLAEYELLSLGMILTRIEVERAELDLREFELREKLGNSRPRVLAARKRLYAQARTHVLTRIKACRSRLVALGPPV